MFMEKHESPKIAKAILEKSKDGGIVLLVFHFYNKTSVK